jgi:hypothetical protein
MADILGKRWPVGTVLTLGAVAATGLLASRYFGTRKVSSAERLAEALLDIERLREANRNLPDASEAALAHCAAYLAEVAHRASAGMGVAAGAEDRVGFSRTQSHAYTGAVVTILTEADSPDRVLTYALDIPLVGEVRGTRKVGGVRMSGLTPVRRTPDTLQITLTDGYTAQLESDLMSPDFLTTGANRISGSVTLRDNRGNVGRLNIGNNGTLSGTVTRDAQVVGRFEGKVAQGLEFTRYQIESSEESSAE